MSVPYADSYPWVEEPLHPPHDDMVSEVILEGSDAEADEAELKMRRERREKIGWAYVRTGRAPYIMSASLKGPFNNGWKNPWLRKRVIPSIEPVTKDDAITYTGPLELSESENDNMVVRPSPKDLDRAAWLQKMKEANLGTTNTFKPTMKRKSPALWLRTVEIKRARKSSPRQESPAALAESRKTTRRTNSIEPSRNSTSELQALQEPRGVQTCVEPRINEVSVPKISQRHASSKSTPVNDTSMSSLNHQSGRQSPRSQQCSDRSRNTRSRSRRSPPGIVTILDDPDEMMLHGLSQASSLAKSAISSSQAHDPKSLAPDSPYDLSDLLDDNTQPSKMAGLLSSACLKRRMDNLQYARLSKGARHKAVKPDRSGLAKGRRSIDLDDIDSPGFTVVARERDVLRRVAAQITKQKSRRGSWRIAAEAVLEAEPVTAQSKPPPVITRSRTPSQKVFELDAAVYTPEPVEIDGIEIKDPMRQPFELGGVPVGEPAAQPEGFLIDGKKPGPVPDAIDLTLVNTEPESHTLSKQEAKSLQDSSGPENDVDPTLAETGRGDTGNEDDLGNTSPRPSQAPTASHNNTTHQEADHVSPDDSGATSMVVLELATAPMSSRQSVESRMTQPQNTISTQPEDPHQAVTEMPNVDDTWEDLELGSPTLSHMPVTILLDEDEDEDAVSSLHDDPYRIDVTGDAHSSAPPSPLSSHSSLESGAEADESDIQIQTTGNTTAAEPEVELLQSPWVKADTALLPPLPNNGIVSRERSMSDSSQEIFHDSQSLPQPEVLEKDVVQRHEVEAEVKDISEEDEEEEQYFDIEAELDNERPLDVTQSQHERSKQTLPTRPQTPEQETFAFADLMTPSPERPRPIRSSPIFNTQQLIAAALNNPWISSMQTKRPKKPKKRVCFGPPPNSDSNNHEPEEREPNGSTKSRLASPPPPPEMHRVLMEDDRFRGLLKSTPERLAIYKNIPSPSQRSPGVGLVAEAFINSEKHQQIVDSNGNPDHSLVKTQDQSPFGGRAYEVTEANVSGVLEEMSSFLDGWDIEDELKKARRGIVI